MGKGFCLLVLVVLLFLLSPGIVRAEESSYIIVHALNPEGVEIDSIEGSGFRSVKIYDGDTVLVQNDEPYVVIIGSDAIFKISNYHTTITSSSGEKIARSESQEAETYAHNIFTGDTSTEERAWANARNGVIFTVHGGGQSSAYATVSMKLKNYYSFARRAGASDVYAQVVSRLWSHIVSVTDSLWISSKKVCHVLLRDNDVETCSGEDLWLYFSVNLQAGKTYFIDIYAATDMWKYDRGTVEMESHNLVVVDEVQVNWLKKRPIASFTYSPEKPMVGGIITFDASSSYDPDGLIVKYEWDFGDGNTAEGTQVSHAYAKAGEYTVTLTVTDDDGLKNSLSKNLYVDIGDIKITPENPTTVEKVTFEIKDLPPDVDITWIITPIEPRKAGYYPVIGRTNPFIWDFPGDFHGTKRVEARVRFGDKIFSKTKDFKLFFQKLGDDNFNGIPNWFEYWKQDRAVPNMGPFIYNPRRGYGAFVSPATLELGPHASGVHYPSGYTIGGITFGGVIGVDTAVEVVAHELYHKWVYDNWHNSWSGQPDPDRDELPDNYEETVSNTNPYHPDTHNVAGIRHYPPYASIGDQEWMAMRAGNGREGIDENDWAYPGSQINGVTSLFEFSKSNAIKQASRYVKQTVLQTEFMSNYSDYGNDINGNSLYDYLTISMGINVNDTGYYVIIGWLNDTYGNEVDLINNLFYLEAGIKTIELNFDGINIHQHGVDGPYSLSLILANEEGDEFDSKYNIYNTSPYNYTQFEGQQIWFTGNFSDYGTDTNGDGIYDYLTIEVGTNTTIAGNYTIKGYLYYGENAIVFASNLSYLDIGTQTIKLNFDAWYIAQSKINGPYTLSYLRILDEDKEIDFLHEAYNTSAYNYTDFEGPLIEFTGNFNDYGVNEDNNSLYDYLIIEAEVNVSEPGSYTIMAWLYANETGIVKTTSFDYLNAGIRTLNLEFNGSSIYRKSINGPYTLTHLTLHDENGSMVKYEWDVYNTLAYNYTEFQGRLLGDVNGDCQVNIFDLAAVGLCYGQSATGDCQNADITGDGRINIFDLATVGLNYGQECV